MKATKTAIPDVLIIEPKTFEDERGVFFESYNKKAFDEITGRSVDFVQDNQCSSVKNVLRGLHYQIKNPQGKLVKAISGTIFDVAVDVRKSSPSFGRWVGEILSAENRKQLWVPEGFAHGYFVLSETAEVIYKTTDYYHPEFEQCLIWNDATVGIEWPHKELPIISSKDAKGLQIAFLRLFD